MNENSDTAVNRFDLAEHMDRIHQISRSKGYVLSTACDHSLRGAMKIGYPNIIVIDNVKNDNDASEKARMIVRAKYEQTKVPHCFALYKDGETLGVISSPEYNDVNNLPLCDFCYEEGTNRSARFLEHFNRGVNKFSCSEHAPDDGFLKKLAARVPVNVVDLVAKKEIFSNR